LVGIKSQSESKAFQPLAHQRYFIDSRGLCIQLSKWYNDYYDRS